MDARTRARAARVSRETLPGQLDVFHVEHVAPPTARELLVSILGAVEVKQ
jgi:hypothetical protein